MHKLREIIFKILNLMCQKSVGIIKKVTFTLITSKPSHLKIIFKILNLMCQKSGGIIKKVTSTLITSKPSHLRVECFTDTTLLNLLKVLKCNVFLNAYHSLLNSLIAF